MDSGELIQLVPRPRVVESGCPAAVRFAAWIEEHLAELMEAEKPPLLAVQRLVVRLAWQYFFERKGLEADHRDRVRDDNGELCCYGLWLVAMERLHELHMAAEKIPLMERVVVQPPAPVKAAPRLEDGLPRPPEIVMHGTHPGDV